MFSGSNVADSVLKTLIGSTTMFATSGISRAVNIWVDIYDVSGACVRYPSSSDAPNALHVVCTRICSSRPRAWLYAPELVYTSTCGAQKTYFCRIRAMAAATVCGIVSVHFGFACLNVH